MYFHLYFPSTCPYSTKHRRTLILYNFITIIYDFLFLFFIFGGAGGGRGRGGLFEPGCFNTVLDFCPSGWVFIFKMGTYLRFGAHLNKYVMLCT